MNHFLAFCILSGVDFNKVIEDELIKTKSESYLSIGIHQRISLKGMIRNKNERSFLNHKEKETHRYFDALNLLWMFGNFKDPIEIFLEKN